MYLPVSVMNFSSLKIHRVRRSLGTAGVLALAFSGGPFGLTWLAATTSAAFLALLSIRSLQVTRKSS